MPHDHSQSHNHDHGLSGEPLELVLTALSVLGLALGFAAGWAGWAQVSLAGYALVYLAGGLPAGWQALKSLWQDHVLDIDLLMVTAALAAAAVGAVPEGAVLLVLFSLSSTLEHQAMGRARRAVDALMALRPQVALKRQGDGSTAEVPVASLIAGDVVVVRPGAKIPVDGTILSGEAAIDQATITGESMPVTKSPGAAVFEATVNLNGVLDITVSRPAAESTVARMIQLVTEAQAAKAPSERFSAWFGQRYTVAVLLGSVLALGVLLWLGRAWPEALYTAATLLVAASPCAIVISVPAAILSALSAAARGGVLFKGGAALETFGAVRQFAFDKTGTLTTGQAKVTAVAPIGMDEAAFLSLLAGLEAQSEHPIATALRAEVAARGLTLAAVEAITAHASEGITGTDADGALWAGNPRMAARMGADLAPLADFAAAAQTVVYLGRGATLLGAACVADTARPTSAAGIAALRAAGITRIMMMTGDRRPVALRIGQALGLSAAEIKADLLPQDKVRLVAEMRKAGKVAFVGDGVNDAAALASADVGIAMGAAGSDVALQAADVALLSDDMARLALAHRLAQRTGRIIRQNLIFAMGAMAVLVTSTLLFRLPLPFAVVGHEGGTLLVVLNGLRLLIDPIRADRTSKPVLAAPRA